MAQKINIVITAEDKASKPLRSVTNEIDGTSSSASRFKSIMAGAGKVALTAGAIGFAALATGAVAAANASWDQVSAVEQATVALGAYEKNGDKVSAVLKGLVGYARSDMGVLFNRKDLFESAQSLKIMGDNTANLTEHVKILSRSVGLGLSNWTDLNQIVGRVGSTGRLTGDDFDNLTKAGYKLAPSLRNTNITFDKLFKALDKGIPVDAMAGQASTIQGIGIRLQTAFRGIGDAILGVDKDTSKFVEGGLGDLAVKGIGGLTAKLRELTPTVRDVMTNVQGSLKVLFSGTYEPQWFAGLDENHPVIQFFKSVHEAFRKAWEFLKPTFDELGQVVKEQLAPAFADLWKEIEPNLLPALKMVAFVVGGTLLVALYAAVKLLTGITWVVTGVVRGLQWLSETIRGSLTDAFSGAIQAGQNVSAFFSNLPGNIGLAFGAITGRLIQFVSSDIPNFVGGVVSWFQQLPQNIAAALSGLWGQAQSSLASFGKSFVAWGEGVVDAIVDFFLSLPSRISQAINGATKSVGSWFSDLTKGFTAGLNSTKGHASGTNSSPGGFRWVGEHGPEPMMVPQGAAVTPAYRARQGAPGGASSPSVVIENYNSYNDRDDNRFFRDLGFALELK